MAGLASVHQKAVYFIENQHRTVARGFFKCGRNQLLAFAHVFRQQIRAFFVQQRLVHLFGQPFHIGALARAWWAIQTQTAHLRFGKTIGQLLQILTAVNPLYVVNRADVGLAIEVGADALCLERVVQ